MKRKEKKRKGNTQLLSASRQNVLDRQEHSKHPGHQGKVHSFKINMFIITTLTTLLCLCVYSSGEIRTGTASAMHLAIHCTYYYPFSNTENKHDHVCRVRKEKGKQV